MTAPDPIPWFDVVIILALIVLNGVLSMSELAIVSSREARLKAMAKSGSSGVHKRARFLMKRDRYFIVKSGWACIRRRDMAVQEQECRGFPRHSASPVVRGSRSDARPDGAGARFRGPVPGFSRL